MFTEILRGLSTTFKEIFSKPVTIAYPEVKRPVRSRFKGRHVLKRYDNGLEKCIGCSLCAAACRPSRRHFRRGGGEHGRETLFARRPLRLHLLITRPQLKGYSFRFVIHIFLLNKTPGKLPSVTRNILLTAASSQT